MYLNNIFCVSNKFIASPLSSFLTFHIGIQGKQFREKLSSITNKFWLMCDNFILIRRFPVILNMCVLRISFGYCSNIVTLPYIVCSSPAWSEIVRIGKAPLSTSMNHSDNKDSFPIPPTLSILEPLKHTRWRRAATRGASGKLPGRAVSRRKANLRKYLCFLFSRLIYISRVILF